MIKTEQLRQNLSRQDLSSFGLEDMAFIKPIIVEGQTLYSIHAADGTPLTTVAQRDLAFATVRQHEMEPASVH